MTTVFYVSKFPLHCSVCHPGLGPVDWGGPSGSNAGPGPRRWFVLQSFGVYYDDYMRSVDVCFWDFLGRELLGGILPRYGTLWLNFPRIWWPNLWWNALSWRFQILCTINSKHGVFFLRLQTVGSRWVQMASAFYLYPSGNGVDFAHLLPLLPELEALNDLLDITCFVLPQSSDGVNFGCHLQFSNHFRDLKSQNSQCLG